MMHETKLTCDSCDVILKGKETFDYKSKRIQMKFDDTLRSHFIRSADGQTLEHYDMCFTCSDNEVERMDELASKHGNPTSKQRKADIERVKEEMLKQSETKRIKALEAVK